MGLSQLHKAGNGRPCHVDMHTVLAQKNTSKPYDGWSCVVAVEPSTISTPNNQNQDPYTSLDDINCK